jgi:hypothetical protein
MSRFPLASDTFEHGKNLTGKDALVTFLNELFSEIQALDMAEAADTNLSATLSNLDDARSGLRAEIAQALDDAVAALYSETGAITNVINANRAEAQAALSGVESTLVDAILAGDSDTLDAAVSTLYSESGVLTNLINAHRALAIADVTGVETVLRVEIQDGDEEAKDLANSALTAEVSRLNDRIGKKSSITTQDGSTITLSETVPGPEHAVRVEKKVISRRVDRLETAVFSILALARAIPAKEILTFSTDAPADGDDFTLGSETYIWRTAITPGTPNEVKIGTGGSAAVRIEESIDNAVKAINLTGTDDVEYGAGTRRNLDASAIKASITTLQAVARLPGTGGNSIAIAETGANTAWGGAGFLSGGLGMQLDNVTVTAEHKDDAGWTNPVLVLNGAGDGYKVDVTGEADKPIKHEEEDSSMVILQ